MKKRIFSLFLAVCMAVSLTVSLPIPAGAASSGTCGENLTWTLDDSGTLTISGSGEMTDYTSSSVPWFSLRAKIKNIIITNAVTSIGEHAFGGCQSLTSVTIGNSVKSIGECAFITCRSLTNVIIGDSVISIGNNAFYECSSLTSVTIGNSVTSIGEWVFGFCHNLTSVTMGNSMKSIGYGAFDNCDSLTSVTIPDSMTMIDSHAFSSCKGLTSVIIGNSVTSIGDSAFGFCTGLTDVYYTGSKERWKQIRIGLYNPYLTNATIHYNYNPGGQNAGITNSIVNMSAAELSLTVYENKNDSSRTADSYRLSEKASVSNGIDAGSTDKNGLVVLKNDGSNVTIRKPDYLDRTLTAARAQKAKNIYLQKDTGEKPVIQAVWLEDTDVYATEYPLDITSSDQITLEAEVVWKSGTPSRIYLMQDAVRAEFNGTSLTTVLSDGFDVSKAIYIVAEDTEGNATKKKLKFKPDGSIKDVLNDYKLSFGDSVTGTIPDSIPVLGGSAVGLDIPMIPLTVTFEDNKFYAVLGLDVAKASSEYGFIANVNGKTTSTFESATKYLFENIKENFTSSVDAYNLSKLKTKWKKATYNYSAKVGFEADVTVIGYLEGYVDSDGKISVLDGGVGVNPSIAFSAGSQIMPVPPLYWEAELKGEIEAMLNLYLNDTAKNFTPNGTVGGKITLKGGVGLGVRSAVGVSGGLKGTVGLEWDIYADEPDYIALSGSIGAYVKAFAGPVTIIDKSFPFAQGVMWDHPSTKVNLLSEFSGTDGYSLIDRSYADGQSFFTANDPQAGLFSYAPQNKTEKTFKTNVYPYSEPQLAEFSDGTMLAVWLDDDYERTAINRTALFYSYYDTNAWSEPVQIRNDGTGDYSPELAVIDGIAYLTWVNARDQLSDNAEISEIFKVWEISAAVFDREGGTFADIRTVTDNASIDMSPKIFGDESGIWLVWVQNASDDFFSETNTYSVMTSACIEGKWRDAEVYASDLMPIDSLTGCRYNGQTYIAYSAEPDGDLQDDSDKEIYLNNARLTENDVLDSKPVFADGSLYYYANGTVAEYRLSDQTTATVVDSMATDRFRVLSDGENRAIVYGGSSALVTELYALMYDAASGKWGNRVALTHLESEISSYSGLFSQNGEMKFIVNKTAISGDLDSENPYGQTDICLFTVSPTYNLSIGEAAYHEELLLPGNTLEFYVEIANNGELTVDKYMVQVFGEDGDIFATTYSKQSLLPGETVDFTAYYPLSDGDFTPHKVKLQVVPIDVHDYDDSDNATEVYLNYENISLENLDYGMDSDGNAVIYGDIVNRGYGIAEGVTATLYKGACGGETVDCVTVEQTLDTLELAAVSFTVPFENDAVYSVKLNRPGRNSGFVVLQAASENTVRFDKDADSITVNSAQDIAGAELLVALYRDGRLFDLKVQPIRLAEGENIFDNPIADCKDADNLKIMVWDSLDTATPLFGACSVTFK